MVASDGSEVASEDIHAESVSGDDSEVVEGHASGVDVVSKDPSCAVSPRPPKLCHICGVSDQESHIAASHRHGIGR